MILDTSEPPGVEKTVTGIVELPDRLSKGGMVGWWDGGEEFFRVEISGLRDSKLQWFDSFFFPKSNIRGSCMHVAFFLTYTYKSFLWTLITLACLVGFQHPRRNPCI